MLAATLPRPPLPADVRLTQLTAHAVAAVAVLALCAAAAAWAARQPVFAVRSIRIEGDVHRNSVSTIRANAAPKLAGNFFTLDLARARAAFESVPWVRRAVVQRVWPDRLRVHLEEHRPAALWVDDNGNDRLVNTHGEVFEANVGDVEDESLPRLAGPEGTAAQMLSMARLVQSALAPLDEGDLQQLALSGRGSWRVVLEGGVTLELGRGTEAEVIDRTQRFVRTIAQVTGHYQRPLLFADLRHPDGYAVRMKGITTIVPAAPARRK
jgi:cell division protein FtsQ